MVISLDGLLLPPNIDGTAELFANDTTRRTVSMKLITKLSTAEKWRITVSFPDAALSPEFLADFYDKCAEMRTQSGQIQFVSPYDGEEKLITAKCVERTLPKALNLSFGTFARPKFYTGAGAVFEEV